MLVSSGSAGDESTEATAAAVLRPRTILEVIDSAFVLARRDYWVFVRLAALFHLPVHAMRLALALAGPDAAITSLDPEQALGLVWWETWNSMAVSAVTVAAARSYTHGAVTLPNALESLRSTLWQIVAATLVVEALFTAGIMLLVVPGVLVLARLFATVPVVYLERLGPWGALKRSFHLTHGEMRRVALSLGLVILGVFVLDSTLAGLVAQWSGRWAVAIVFDFALDSAIYPLVGVTSALLYYDLRIRREGYDIEVMLGRT